MYLHTIKSYKKLLPLILIALILITAFFKKEYFLGGDDTHLYYIYPQLYLSNFSKNIIINTSVSSLNVYFPQTYIVPFNVLLLLLKAVFPFMNIQFFLFWVNILLGFYFFYKLVDLLLPLKNKFDILVKFIGSFFYVFSIFNFYSIFNHQLFAMYLLSLYPLSLYLFIKSLKESNVIYVVMAALAVSIFSVVLMSVPWLGAFLLVSFPIFIYLLIKYKKRFIAYGLIFVSLLFILNFYWIVHTIAALSGKSLNNPEMYLNTDIRQANVSGINTVSSINTIFFPFLGLYHYQIQRIFHWVTTSLFEGWYLKIAPLNLIFPLIIIIAGIIIRKTSKYFNIFLVSILVWILSLYFYTVNITPWGIDMFVFLNNHIPGFVMFRNMYDKFAPALAFSFALALTVCLLVLIDNVKKYRIKMAIITTTLLIIILNALPFFLGKFKLPIWTTPNTYSNINKFNRDYMEMTDYISKLGDNKLVLSLPLTTGNNFLIQDEYTDNFYYSGVSPLLIFSGRNDFSGLLSFGTFGRDVEKYIKNKDYEELEFLFQKMDIGYIVLNKNISEELVNSYHYNGGEFYNQQLNLVDEIAGKKIKDFGERYTLYEVKPEFESDYIFLNSSDNGYEKDNQAKLTYSKVNKGLFQIQVENVPQDLKLIFLEPYNSYWKLLDSNKKEIMADHELAFDYANAWDLGQYKGESDTFYIYFKPYSFYNYTNGISILAAICVISYLVGYLIKNRRKELSR